MIRDAAVLETGTELVTQVCIVGAGAAGITIANELAGSGIDVIMLEGGDFTYTPSSQSLYRGNNIGRPYYNLDATRLRFFGGTTNHYAGDFAPLDALDYEERPGLTDSGWPISPQEMEKYYRGAHEYCQLGPVEYGSRYWSGVANNTALEFDPEIFRTQIRQMSPTRFASAFRESLEESHNVSTYLNANVTNIILDDIGNSVSHVVVKTYKETRFTVRAANFVIAAGGLENPRILLNANSQRPGGIGNKHDLVGRYFMEHIGVSSGLISFAAGRFDEDFYSLRRVDVERHTAKPQAPLMRQAFLCADPDLLRREGLANVRMSFQRFHRDRRRHTGLKSAKFLLRDMARFKKRRDSKDDFVRTFENLDAIAGYALNLSGNEKTPLFKPFTVIEQLPNPNSRVKLVDEKDRFGCRRLALDWQWTADDKRSVLHFQQLVAEELGRTGIGRMRLESNTSDAVSFGVPFSRQDRFGNYVRAGNHHIGTTRMSNDPKRGVTDRNCRVHDTTNLFVAGSSVFPTAGLWNPTLTIVALSIRLSDRLKKNIK